jgi:hypothetical protein
MKQSLFLRVKPQPHFAGDLGLDSETERSHRLGDDRLVKNKIIAKDFQKK